MEKLAFTVRVRLLPSEQGGRTQPVFTRYRPSWNLGNTWLGNPTLNDGQLLLEGCSEIAPGGEGLARLEPLVPESWGALSVGTIIALQEGSRVLGQATILAVASRPEHFTADSTAFVEQARQYCEFISRAGELPLPERLIGARDRLLALHTAACALQPVESGDDVEKVRDTRPPANWQGFEAFEHYWEIFDPYVDDEAVAGSLSDDLLDVYFDVKCGLELWDRDIPKSSAIQEWGISFEIHWGDHAIDALRALHRACARV